MHRTAHVRRPRLLAVRALALVVVALALPASAGAAVLTLSNERVSVGVDLERGGAITELTRPGGANLVNNYDLGRQIQASYYSGPVPFGVPEDPQWNGAATLAARRRVLPAGRWRTVRVHPTRRALRRVRTVARPRGRATVRVTVRATTAAGGRAVVRRVTVVRP